MSEMSFGEKLITSAKEAEAHSADMKKLRSNTVKIAPVPEYAPKQIKAVRVRLGLTQGVLGQIVGVSAKTVEAWESGFRRPSSSAKRVLAELDTNPSYFGKIASVESIGAFTNRPAAMAHQ